MTLPRLTSKLVITGGRHAQPGDERRRKSPPWLNLPSRQELHVQAPGDHAGADRQVRARTLNEVPGKFVRTLAAVRDQKEEADCLT